MVSHALIYVEMLPCPSFRDFVFSRIDKHWSPGVFRVGFVVQHLDRLFVQLHAGINPAMVVGWLRPGVNRQDSLVSEGTA